MPMWPTQVIQEAAEGSNQTSPSMASTGWLLTRGMINYTDRGGVVSETNPKIII